MGMTRDHQATFRSTVSLQSAKSAKQTSSQYTTRDAFNRIIRRRFYDSTPVTLFFYSKRVSAEENLFQRELKYLKTVDHPNCIKLLGTVVTPRGERIFLFPRCEMSLRQYMEKYPHLEYPNRMRILGEIASALRYLHERHIILKTLSVRNLPYFHPQPDTIQIQNGHAVIADFGLLFSIQAITDDLLF